MSVTNKQERHGKCLSLILSFFLVSGLLLGSCGSDNSVEPEPEPEPEPVDTGVVLDPLKVDTTGFYIPEELKKINFYKSSSVWYHGRSKASEHFIVFWGRNYGDRDPNSAEVPDAYRVDIDDLLVKGEQFYEINVNELKFAETGVGKSNLDKYKILIFY